jgi:hypothetical protein
MKLAITLLAHGHTELVLDTIDSIREYVTEDILVVVDGAAWNTWGNDIKVPAYKMSGFYHNLANAPYRNVAFGLMNTTKLFPGADWYGYVDYDVLFTSDSFKNDLEKANSEGVWVVGNDVRPAQDDIRLDLLEQFFQIKLEEIYYVLGCCHFYNNKFIKMLWDINFFEKFLWLTNGFTYGFFPAGRRCGPSYPGSPGYIFDLSEYLYPSLAFHLGGRLKGMAKCEKDGTWKGDYKKYPMRWKPELGPNDYFEEATIMHPVKEALPIRYYQREKRNLRRTHGT